MLDDAFRCPDCGKSRVQKATSWASTTGSRGESVTRAKSFEAFDAEVHCTCPRSGLRSIPYIRQDNAAGASAVDAHTTGSTSEADTLAPQPSSTPPFPHDRGEAGRSHNTLSQCPACGDDVKRPGLCVSCDVYDSGEPDIAPMTGRINYGCDVDPYGSGR